MKGDFSRTTFDRRHRFSRVLMQQGRVLLDADWNEQTSILLHYLRTLAADLIGPHGGPGRGFEIGCTGEDDEPLACDFTIGWGHYYVDGILVENVPPVRCPPGDDPPPLPTYGNQPDYPLKRNEKLEHGTNYLVYLDVWERHLTPFQADHIREVALGGPDTATRSKVVWQVKVAKESDCGHDENPDATCWDLLQAWVEEGPRCLRARARVPEPSDDPCVIPPEARYRGAENQLYRVEIHRPSKDRRGRPAKSGATFKWSRDNGSVVLPVRDIRGSTVTLDTLGPDRHRGLEEGDWVEVVDDGHVLRGRPGVLARVDAVDRVRFEVTLVVPADEDLPRFRGARRPLLRRWDQGSDALPVREGKWIDLEDGVQVYFEPDGTYRTGDYWLIHARTATGDVLWPTEENEDGRASPQALPPRGIEHHYAPLARIRVDEREQVSCLEDCRCTFEPLCAPVSRLEDVYFARDSAELAAGMAEVLSANAAVLRARLSSDEHLEAAVMGFAPSATGGEELAMERAEIVMRAYVEAGSDEARMSVRAAVDDRTHPTQARDRVETRLVHASAADRVSAEVRPAGGTRPSEEERRVELVRIANVGAARANVLLAAGRDTPEAVGAMSTEEIRALLNVSDTLAESIRESARDIARQ